MIHRVVLGSLERFIGILIENFSGNLPPWLAPVQAVVLPISEKFAEYAEKINNRLLALGYRSEIDNRVESLSKKIRQAELCKIPYMIITGEQEEKTETVTVRKKSGGDIKNISINELTEIIGSAVKSRAAMP
jgi:threonyl-tRNA synthetase